MLMICVVTLKAGLYLFFSSWKKRKRKSSKHKRNNGKKHFLAIFDIQYLTQIWYGGQKKQELIQKYQEPVM